MLTSLLSSLHFDEDEIKTYLFLLTHGPHSVGSLSKKIGFVRSSLYGFLQRLQEQGLITQSQKQRVKIFSAEPPEKINLLFDEKIEELQQKQTEYKKLLPELRASQPALLLNPKFQIFEGVEGLKYVLKDMLLYKDMETQAYWPIKKMVEILTSDFFRYHNKERIKNNLYTRAIWPQNEVLDLKKHPYLGVGKDFKREIRIAPKDINFTMGYWIYGNKVAFLSSRQESFGYIIESSELVEMLLTQFEVIWKMSKPLKSQPKYTDNFIKIHVH